MANEDGGFRPIDEDLQHLEANLYRVIAVARTLARDTDSVQGIHWNEPYAYRAAEDAIKATRNLRRQLETHWLVTPLDPERPPQDPSLTPKR